MKTNILLLLLLLTGINAKAQQKWQKITIPTISELKNNFENSPAQYGPTVVWGWNGPVDSTVIENELDILKNMGMKAVIIEAGYKMKYDYLSAGWFELIKYAVEQAGKREMKVWFIDEGKYPSGFAGGKFSQERPDLRMQGLDFAGKFELSSGETFEKQLQLDVISAAAFNEDSSSLIIPIKNNKINWTAPKGNWKLLLIKHRFRTSVTRAANNPTMGKDTTNSLCDYLNPLATKQFIEFTHEQYKKYTSDEFGKTILGFRGDEPDYGFIPWTPKLPEIFKEKKGYDILPFIATFFIPKPTEEMVKAKADYWDVWSGLFGENFFGVQAEWCAKNNVEYMVHLNKEDDLMALARSGGDFFRNTRYVQIPGVDAIWNQIWPDKIADYPKLASSAAHLYGKKRAMSESFAAYKIMPNIEEAKWVVDYQFARGINCLEFMFFGSKAGAKDRFTYNYLASDTFPKLADYTNRASYLLSQGKPTARIGIYVPTYSFWLGDEEANTSFLDITHKLLEMQRDFDYIDEQAIALSSLEGDKITNLSGQSYQTIIIPSITAISTATIVKLKQFAKNDGKVIFLGKKPSLEIEKNFLNPQKPGDLSWAIYEPSGKFTPEVMKAMPYPDVFIGGHYPDIRYVHRELKDGELYFFFNESKKKLTPRVILDGTGTIEIWDAYNKKTGKVNSIGKLKNQVQFQLELNPWESKFIIVSTGDKTK